MVGPLTSLAVGRRLGALCSCVPDGLLLMVVEGLAVANLLVGALNLVPGLPLDGGRVLKAAVWKLHRQPAPRHDRGAAWGGRVTAVAVLLWPVGAAGGCSASSRTSSTSCSRSSSPCSSGTAPRAPSRPPRCAAGCPHLVARNLARRTLAVPEDLPLAEAVRRAREAHAGAIVTVTSSGRPVGVVNEAALLATPEDRRPWAGRVDGRPRPGRRPVAAGDISGEDLVRAITRRPATEYLLVEHDGSVYGVLTTADVDRAFRAVPD